MAESRFNLGRQKPQANIPSAASKQRGIKSDTTISCRATNPLSIQDDLTTVFLDERQAKATTATRLFRNNELFDAITKVVMPAYFASSRGKFSMWSTGCSSGEEVYSMAMIALTEYARAKRPPLMEAFGTDINKNRIAEARQGIYGRPTKDAFPQNYWRLLQQYSTIDDHYVHMGDQLRTLCKFMLFDMRQRPKKHTFFFIVCNHVLQYYDNDGQHHILANLKAVLNPGGYLYLEGITKAGLQGSNLKLLATSPNLYCVG